MTPPRRKLSRRAFLWGAGAASAGLACLVHAWAWARSLVPNVRKEPPARRRIGPPDRFPLGHTYLADHQLFLIRDEKGFRALSAVCTHLGCTVGRSQEGYHCPCHGSRFDADGTNTAGPAPRPLHWRKIDLSGGGNLVVDFETEVAADARLAFAWKPPARGER